MTVPKYFNLSSHSQRAPINIIPTVHNKLLVVLKQIVLRVQYYICFFSERQAEFKAAALHCKKSGDKTLALEFLKTVKQFDVLITAYKSTTEGMDFDIADLPSIESVAAAVKSQKTEDETQKSSGEYFIILDCFHTIINSNVRGKIGLFINYLERTRFTRSASN